jgi:hypothetical protein
MGDGRTALEGQSLGKEKIQAHSFACRIGSQVECAIFHVPKAKIS